MRKRAWVTQLKSQVAKFGEDDAPWKVQWIDPEGKRKTRSCGPGKKGRKAADNLADKIHAQLVTGTYEDETVKSWEAFRKKYDARILSQMDGRTKETTKACIERFERIAKPKRMASLTSETIADYVAERRKEKGILSKTISPATINKELRVLRSVLRLAHDWGDLKRVPKFAFLKQPKKMPIYVPPEHFAAIYEACENAPSPTDVPNVTPKDWWQGLVTMAYLTGWRIGQLLALRWEDVDLEAGTVLSRAEDNKGRRDELIPVHPIVIEHLRRLTGSFDTHVFPWNKNRRQLWWDFGKIQETAKIAGDKPMPKCGKTGWYGFHDLRRGFATQNAAEMDLFELQALMQHKSLDTTRLYVSMANQLKRTVDGIYVPDFLKPAKNA